MTVKKKLSTTQPKPCLKWPRDQHRIGLMDDANYRKITVRHLGEKASHAEPISPRRFAHPRTVQPQPGRSGQHVELTVGYLSQLERGVKQPKGPSLALLNVIRARASRRFFDAASSAMRGHRWFRANGYAPIMTRVAIIAAMPGELKPLVRGWPHSPATASTSGPSAPDEEEEWIAACAGAGPGSRHARLRRPRRRRTHRPRLLPRLGRRAHAPASLRATPTTSPASSTPAPASASTAMPAPAICGLSPAPSLPTSRKSAAWPPPTRPPWWTWRPPPLPAWPRCADPVLLHQGSQ